MRCIDVAAVLPHVTHQPLFLIGAEGRVGDQPPISTTSHCPIFTSHSALPRHATRGEPGPIRGPVSIDSRRHSSQCREQSERNWQQRTIVICVAGPGESHPHQPPTGIHPCCISVEIHRQYWRPIPLVLTQVLASGHQRQSCIYPTFHPPACGVVYRLYPHWTSILYSSFTHQCPGCTPLHQRRLIS